MVLEQWDIQRKKNEPQPKSTTLHKKLIKMDHGLKYKTYICKTLRKNNKRKSLVSRTRQRVPTLDTKSTVHKSKHGYIRFNQNEKLLLCEKPLSEDEKNLEIEKKNLQTTHITKDHCLEYIKNPQNLTVKNHTIQLENGQKT